MQKKVESGKNGDSEGKGGHLVNERTRETQLTSSKQQKVTKC
jgi:hypothetical protein